MRKLTCERRVGGDSGGVYKCLPLQRRGAAAASHRRNVREGIMRGMEYLPSILLSDRAGLANWQSGNRRNPPLLRAAPRNSTTWKYLGWLLWLQYRIKNSVFMCLQPKRILLYHWLIWLDLKSRKYIAISVWKIFILQIIIGKTDSNIFNIYDFCIGELFNYALWNRKSCLLLKQTVHHCWEGTGFTIVSGIMRESDRRKWLEPLLDLEESCGEVKF